VSGDFPAPGEWVSSRRPDGLMSAVCFVIQPTWPRGRRPARSITQTMDRVAAVEADLAEAAAPDLRFLRCAACRPVSSAAGFIRSLCPVRRGRVIAAGTASRRLLRAKTEKDDLNQVQLIGSRALKPNPDHPRRKKYASLRVPRAATPRRAARRRTTPLAPGRDLDPATVNGCHKTLPKGSKCSSKAIRNEHYKDKDDQDRYFTKWSSPCRHELKSLDRLSKNSADED